jgi:DNA (cytosine-5)-methyltransferase 1
LVGKNQPHLLVDVFAGPGGLGEGFLSRTDAKGRSQFKSALSVEKDSDAHATLTLRHFVRAFGSNEFPEDYYSYFAGDLSLDELYASHPKERASAEDSARQITLGEGSHAEVKRLLSARLKNHARWALVGGPPCQAYSLVGRSRMGGTPDFEQDERHFLYKEYLKIIADHRPPIFVMENVKGLLSATIEGVSMITRIVADLQNPLKAVWGKSSGVAYRLYSLVEQEEPGGTIDPRLFIVRAEKFGVPQARHRMFIIGVRSDLNVRPSLLKHHDAPSVRDMIGDLPRIRSRLSREVDSPARWRSVVTMTRPNEIAQHLNGSTYAKVVRSEIEVATSQFSDWPENAVATTYASRPGRPTNAVSLVRDPLLQVLDGHVSRSHMASDLQRYMFAAVFAETTKRSPKLADFPLSLLPAHGNVFKGVSGDMFADRFRVQLPDRVSTTITSHISKDGHYFIHYDPLQCRSLTLREAARLQTFPDNYRFLGNRTSQYHQVGNAVPPHLASQIADIVADALDRVREEA